MAAAGESRGGVPLTNLDAELFEGADARKRDLVDYLDAIHRQLVAALRQRPLSVIRVTGRQAPFMQKNLPAYAPEWIDRITLWAESSKRDVTYALCNDRRTLLWFANQRAVEYHPTLARAAHLDRPTHLVLDIDPPVGAPFATAVAAVRLVGAALEAAGMRGAVKTSGAKGLHVFVPIRGADAESAAAATRAIAQHAERIDPAVATTAFLKDERQGKVFIDATRSGGATVVAAYSPRARPGTTVSFPVGWDELDDVEPRDFTIRNVPDLVGDGDPWTAALGEAQALPADLVAAGREIPVPRVAAMHEGRRRARSRRER